MSQPSEATDPLVRKYWAFISHSHQDDCRSWFFFRERWGQALHRRLETYRIPKKMVGRETPVGTVPARIFPVFLDTEELPTSPDLSDSIQSALRESKTLIVICSPSAERSRWVGEEIKAFKSMGDRRQQRVLCLIVDGEPNASDKPGSELQECFPEALRYHVDQNGNVLLSVRVEPIAADVRPGGSSLHDATLKIVAGVLGLPFAELKRRDATRWWWQVARAVLVVTFVLGIAVWIAESARRGALTERAALHEWRIKEQNMPFPQMAGKYSEQEIALLRARRDTAEKSRKLHQFRETEGVGRPADTQAAAHDQELSEAELAWAEGDLFTSEVHLQKAVQHVEKEAEIAALRFEFGMDNFGLVSIANNRRDQTQLALVRLKRVIEDLQAAGYLKKTATP